MCGEDEMNRWEVVLESKVHIVLDCYTLELQTKTMKLTFTTSNVAQLPFIFVLNEYCSVMPSTA